MTLNPHAIASLARGYTASVRIESLHRRLSFRLPRHRPRRCSPGVWALFQGLRISITGRPGISPSQPVIGLIPRITAISMYVLAQLSARHIPELM